MHKHCLPCARAKRATNSSCESERERAKHSTKRALQSRCFFFFVLLPLAALLRHETFYFLFLCKRFVFYLFIQKLLTLSVIGRGGHSEKKHVVYQAARRKICTRISFKSRESFFLLPQKPHTHTLGQKCAIN